MKVFDILKESLPDGWSLAREDGNWVARDPSGAVRATGRVRGNVEAQAERWIERNPTRTPAPSSEQPSTRPSTSTSPETPELRSGVRPGTPTSDSLSAGEQRRLARNGQITRRGVTYTRAQIQAADAEAARLRNSTAGRDVRPGDDRPGSSDPEASRNRNPNAPEGSGRLRRIARWLGRFSSGGFLGLGYALVSIEQLTSYLDGYMEVLERPEVDFDQSHPDARRAYVELRNQVVATMMSSVAQIGLTVAWITGFIRIASRFTGPIGWVIGFVIGAGASYAMDWITNKIANDTGFASWLSEQIIFRHILAPDKIQEYALNYQKFRDGLLGPNESEEEESEAPNVTAAPIGQGTPDLEDLVRDWYQNDEGFRQGVDRARESGEAITPRNAIATIEQG